MSLGRPRKGTMVAPDTGALLVRGVRPFMVTYRDLTKEVMLPGYYPSGAGEGIHVGDDFAVVDEALAELRRRAEECPARAAPPEPSETEMPPRRRVSSNV